jgi:hypothetical protein
MLSWELRAATSLVRLLRRQEHPQMRSLTSGRYTIASRRGLVPPILSRRNDYWMSWGIVGSRLVKRWLSWCLSVKARKARAERGRTWKQEANQGEFPALIPRTAYGGRREMGGAVRMRSCSWHAPPLRPARPSYRMEAALLRD